MVYLNIFFLIALVLYLWWLWGLMSAFRRREPFVPTKKAAIARMLEMVAPRPGDVWIDLGSGDGRVLIAAAKKFPIQGIGIERVASFRILARLRAAFAGVGSKTRFIGGDFFSADITEARYISVYLLRDMQQQAFDKIMREARPGTEVLYYRFPMAGAKLKSSDETLGVYCAVVDRSD